MRRLFLIESPPATQRWLFRGLNNPALNLLPVMGVANLATERGMRAALLAPEMFGQEPLLILKKWSRKESLNSHRGEGQKGEREKEIPRSETQGQMTRIKGSVSTSPEETGLASTGTRAVLSTRAPKGEEEEEANGKETLPYSLPTLTRGRS